MTTDSATKILVADDDLEILALGARHLSALPAEIVEASDGEEALRLARKEKPSLVVLDVMTPAMFASMICRAGISCTFLARPSILNSLPRNPSAPQSR